MRGGQTNVSVCVVFLGGGGNAMMMMMTTGDIKTLSIFKVISLIVFFYALLKGNGF